MARFIDHAAALDVEIVDDWLFLYGQRQFSSLDPGDLGVAVLGRRRTPGQARAVGAVARRAPADGCRARHPLLRCPTRRRRRALRASHRAAPASTRRRAAGRRLTRRFGWVGVVVIGAFVLIWLFQVSPGCCSRSRVDGWLTTPHESRCRGGRPEAAGTSPSTPLRRTPARRRARGGKVRASRDPPQPIRRRVRGCRGGGCRSTYRRLRNITTLVRRGADVEDLLPRHPVRAGPAEPWGSAATRS